MQNENNIDSYLKCKQACHVIMYMSFDYILNNKYGYHLENFIKDRTPIFSVKGGSICERKQ